MKKEPTGWLPPFSIVHSVFGRHRTYRIIDQVEKEKLFNPLQLILPDGEIKNSDDHCGAAFVNVSPSTELGQKLRKKLIKKVPLMNRQFEFDLFDLEDPRLIGHMIISRYSSDKPIGLPPHTDLGGFPEVENRKLTVVIPLNSPYLYEGGRLMIQDGLEHDAFGENWNNQITEGYGVVFPSFRMHHVTPVTRATRYTLTAFLQGPRFR